MKPTKHKILAIETVNKAMLIDETKPDRRCLMGYRKTGVKLPKIGVSTTLIVSPDPQIRFGQFVEVVGYGKMRVTDITKTGEIRLRNVKLDLLDTYSLSFKVDDYIDVLPL